MKLLQIARLLKLDWFLFGMMAAAALAWVFPDAGAKGGALHADVLTKAGVAAIFFFYGLTLSWQALLSGFRRWRLHATVQGTTFLFFPLLGLTTDWLAGGFFPPELRVGFLFLCALPSTISSSVAMTATAGGNVAGAVFNATLSNVSGVVLTPLWIACMVPGTGTAGGMGPVIVTICYWLVLPMAVGQLARLRWHAWADGHWKRIRIMDRWVILLIIYTSFSDSVKQGVWQGHGAGILLGILALAGIYFAVVLWALKATTGALGFSREDRIAAIFCGSQKTLATGVPMAAVIFGSHPGLGLILLPIMVYHPLQLVVCGLLAERWRKQAAGAP